MHCKPRWHPKVPSGVVRRACPLPQSSPESGSDQAGLGLSTMVRSRPPDVERRRHSDRDGNSSGRAHWHKSSFDVRSGWLPVSKACPTISAIGVFYWEQHEVFEVHGFHNERKHSVLGEPAPVKATSAASPADRCERLFQPA